VQQSFPFAAYGSRVIGTAATTFLFAVKFIKPGLTPSDVAREVFAVDDYLSGETWRGVLDSAELFQFYCRHN
jgi:hypothetical protein